MSQTISKAGTKFFYGYIIVAAIFTLSFVMFGTFSAFGIFFKPLSEDLGWTRAMTSGAFSLAYAVMGIFNFIGGRLTDKVGPRIVLLVCGILLFGGYLSLSGISQLWQMYVFYGLVIGMGMSGGDTPVLATLARWFVRRRGLFTGLSKIGAGLGILAVAPLVNWLIESYGWRDSFIIIGITCLVGVVGGAVFLKRDPHDSGLLPDGDSEVSVKKEAPPARQYSLREVISTSQFWIFMVVWFFLIYCCQSVMIHTAPNVTDKGLSATVGAIVMSVIGGFSIAGRAGIGAVSDKIGPKNALITAILFLTVALVWVQFSSTAWMFYIFAALYGVAHGAFFTLLGTVLAELFGLRDIGAIIGAVFCVGTFGGALGPLVAGSIFDVSGSYRVAFLICLAFSVTSIILMLYLKPTSRT